MVPHNGENNEEIRGILDFSDMIHSSYLFEIAVAITYLSLDDSDRLEDIAASIILGYRRNFTELEFNLLKVNKSNFPDQFFSLVLKNSTFFHFVSDLHLCTFESKLSLGTVQFQASSHQHLPVDYSKARMANARKTPQYW